MSTPLRRIVAGIATLAADDPALAPSIRLAERTGADLHLVHVFPPEGNGRDRPADARAGELRERLEAEAKRWSGRGRISCLALPGHAGDTLPRVAAELEADVLVLGLSRRHGAAAAVLGTTAQRVLRSATVPVLALRPEPGALAQGRALLATDLTAHSAQALRRGAHLAAALAHPAPPRLRPVFVTVPSYQAVVAGIPDWSPEHAAVELGEFLRGVPGLAGLEGAARVGDPALEILAEAAQWRADLVVVGTHGRRGLPRLLLGSVAEKVLRRSAVSVLVIPPAGAPHPAAAPPPESRQPLPSPEEAAPPFPPAAGDGGQGPARPIVAGTDLSSASDHVVRSAASLAAATGAPLHVVHALDLAPTVFRDRRIERAMLHERIAEAEAALDAQVARTVAPGVAVAEKRVETHAAHRAIAEHAARVSAAVVVIGPHTHHGSYLGVLGSTTDRLIRTLAVPCLVVRTELGLPLHRVVVPLDLSEPARAALEIGVRWAGTLGARDEDLALPGTEVAVVHVLPRLLSLPDVPFDRAVVEPGLNREVDEAVRSAGSPGNVAVREEVVWNDRPAAEIVAFAWRESADLLVLATHGRAPVARALIGSTAASVVRRIPCPVLLVPPPLWREQPSTSGAAAAPEPEPVPA